MKLPYVAAAAAIGISVTLTGLAAIFHITPAHLFPQAAALMSPVIELLGQGLLFVIQRRFTVEAALLALVTGLHLAILLQGREPGRKLRRVELTVISLYVTVIALNVASVCVGSVGHEAPLAA